MRRRSRRTTNVASRLTSTLVTTGDHFGGRPPRPRRRASGSMNTERHSGQRLTPSPRASGCMAVPSFGHGHVATVCSVTTRPSLGLRRLGDSLSGGSSRGARALATPEPARARERKAVPDRLHLGVGGAGTTSRPVHDVGEREPQPEVCCHGVSVAPRQLERACGSCRRATARRRSRARGTGARNR